jgi:hypothetical protein
LEIVFQIEMNLVAAMRGQYCRSERLLWASVSVKAVIYLATLAIAVWSDPTAAAVLLVIACVGQACLYVLRFATQNHLALAERLRRLAMLQDGVGREVAPLEAAILAEKVWNVAKEDQPDPYYSSKLPKGPKRLIDVTAECAFFSGSIGAAAGRVFQVASVAATSILVLSLVLLIVLGVTQSRLEIAAKVVLIGVTFWMTEDLVDMAFKYRSLGSSCERILQECSRLLDQANPSVEDAYVVLHDYDAAAASAPPLPSLIYRKRNAHLSEIWQETHPCTTARSA